MCGSYVKCAMGNFSNYCDSSVNVNIEEPYWTLVLAGDSGGNRFNHGESQPPSPSRPGTSSGKAETELSLTRDLAHGRNLGPGHSVTSAGNMQGEN